MSIESIIPASQAALLLLRQIRCRFSSKARLNSYLPRVSVRASQPTEGRSRVYKELGLYSLKKKIEDVVVRAEKMAPNALEYEVARQIQHEEMMQKYNLWDDPAKSDKILTALADSTKVVDALKDAQYKAQEAKLVAELAEMDVINYQLFKQAYKTSVDVSKFIDHYNMSKRLTGPYDAEGACVIITAGSETACSSTLCPPALVYRVHVVSCGNARNLLLWSERLLNMYTNWGLKQGMRGRVMERFSSMLGGIKFVTIEFEYKFCYGYLCGEKGMHVAVGNALDGAIVTQGLGIASVDVIPLFFLEAMPHLDMDDKDLEILPASCGNELRGLASSAVSICHIPTGLKAQCSGERNYFANKMKCLNRLKAKLLLVAEEQGVTDVKDIRKTAIAYSCRKEARRYVFQPNKLVKDASIGIQLTDLTSVLDGNLETLIEAHINLRYARNSGSTAA